MSARASASRASSPPGVSPIAHTADLGFDIQAPSLEACFARAAAAVFHSFIPLGRPAGARILLIDVEGHAEGLEELLVAWLEELLYLGEVRGLVLGSFKVLRIDKGQVVGQATGWKAGRWPQYRGPAIKGVTRHGLRVERRGLVWHARVFVDV